MSDSWKETVTLAAFTNKWVNYPSWNICTQQIAKINFHIIIKLIKMIHIYNYLIFQFNTNIWLKGKQCKFSMSNIDTLQLDSPKKFYNNHLA